MPNYTNRANPFSDMDAYNYGAVLVPIAPGKHLLLSAYIHFPRTTQLLQKHIHPLLPKLPQKALLLPELPIILPEI